MPTAPSLLTPADLLIPPDIDACRPRCRCGAVPVFPRVGMHGDGLTHRLVPWPVERDGSFVIAWVTAVGRRFWCPVCRATVRVAHAGLRRGATYGAAVIALLLHVVAPAPVGAGSAQACAYELVHGRPLPLSERARSGRGRWASLDRWLRDVDRIWPSLALPTSGKAQRLHAVLAAFGVGAPLSEVLDAAVRAHAPGGRAM